MERLGCNCVVMGQKKIILFVKNSTEKEGPLDDTLKKGEDFHTVGPKRSFISGSAFRITIILHVGVLCGFSQGLLLRPFHLGFVLPRSSDRRRDTWTNKERCPDRRLLNLSQSSVS